MNTPLVSVITPVLNSAMYIEDAIQSVLNQTYSNIEHVFVDGGSSDSTLNTLAQYQARHPGRIRFVSIPGCGVGEATNKGLTIAKGNIFGWLGSDDLYEPDTIRTVVNFFLDNTDAFFVFGGCNIIDKTGELIVKSPAEDFNLRETINTAMCSINFASAFYRREVVVKVGMLRGEMGSDFDFYIRVAENFRIYRIENTLSCWRLHEGSNNISKEAHKRRMVRNRLREDYLLRRDHGASIFSPGSRKYFMFLFVDKLGIYHFINPMVLNRLRRNSFISRVLKILGA